MQEAKVDRQVRGRLVERGVRYTRARQVVISRVLAADGPRSAAELHEEMGREVPLSSLYRCLAVLEEAGILAPHHGTRGVTRYELAEWLSGHHHHFVCMQCGTIEDVRLGPDTEAELERLVVSISEEASFRAAGHSLEIDGKCARCR